MSWTPRAWIALVLTLTVCGCIGSVIITACFRPPGAVTDATSERLYQLLSFIVGTVSGWLLGTGERKRPEEEKHEGS